MLSVIARPAPAQAAATGTGGQFVSTTGRILDTSTGLGGYSTPFPAGTYRSVQVGGLAGVPTSGVGAVSLVITAYVSSVQGQVTARTDSSSTESTVVATYGGPGVGTASNSAVLPLASDGTVQLRTDTSVKLTIDVQGYYTATGTGVAPGGFVSVTGQRIVDTRSGMGAPKATIPSGGSVTVQITGTAGIPAGASGVVANFIAVNEDTPQGFITPYPAGATKPPTELNFAPGVSVPTSLSAQVGLSSDGKVTVWNASGTNGKIDLVVDVQGYFTAQDGGGSFTPAAGRVYGDSTPFTANQTKVIQITGKQSIPAVQQGVSAVAVSITATHSGSNSGSAVAWADGGAQPGITSVNYLPNSIRSNSVIVPVGANGAIDLINASVDSAILTVDVQGYYTTLPTGPGTTNLTGSRTSATSLSFPIDDQTTAQVDVGTGNLLVSNVAMSAPGVLTATTVGAAYNSRGWQVNNTATPDANRWELSYAAAGDLSTNGTGVVYTTGDGSTWQFTLNADGTFTAPAGLNATLTKSATQYLMTMVASKQATTFNLAGDPLEIKDRHSNTVTFTRSGYQLTGIVSSAGPVGARTIHVAYANLTTTFSQANGSATRSVTYTKDGHGNITSYTDATGETTTFGYSGSNLVKITSPAGGVTNFTYDSSQRVTQVDQLNTTAGSPGTATTRFDYASTTSTIVAGPNTSTSQTVPVAKNTSYTLDATSHLVQSAKDADGNIRSAQYNPTNNGVSQSTVGSNVTGTDGSTAQSKTTNSWNDNGKQSLSSVLSSTGGTTKAEYTSTNAVYSPSKVTDSSGSQSSYLYDGQGNMTSSTSGPTQNSATATAGYNSDGTIKTAQSPLNAAANNNTNYTYDSTTHQLTTVTAPTIAANTGTQPGPKKYTYDLLGRLLTQTDGNNVTETFSYDNDDRTLSETFNDGTPAVTNSYDANGNELTSTSGSGTITNTYDQQNRLISTTNSAGGGLITYNYDKAGNEISTTDDLGTVTYSYDPTNTLWSMTYPHGSGTETDRYQIDDHGRRVNTWVNAGADSSTDATKTAPSTWTGRTTISFDSSNRIEEETASTGTGNSSNTKVFDTTYCYQTTPTARPATGCTGGADTNRMQTAIDNLTGKITTYGYKDLAGNLTTHLTGVTQTGGSNDVNWAYAYDANGNRQSAIETNSAGTTLSSQTLTYNAANQIDTAGYAYDAAGNMTASPGATYTYNGAEQMTSTVTDGTTTSYTYAGASQNELLNIDADGINVDYVYGKAGIDTSTGFGATARVLADATTGQALDLTDSTGATAAFLIDGIGNQIGALTDTGTNAFDVSYDPYGTGGVTRGDDSAFWSQNPYGFKVGARTSEYQGNIVKFGQRWYLAGTGSWTQQDTLDAPLDPTNANRYAYAGDDPINGADPSGRAFVGPSVSLCILGCLDVGFNFDDRGIGVTGGYGVGADLGVSGQLLGGPGGNTSGSDVGVTCQGVDGGGVAGRGYYSDTGFSGSGGFAIGAEDGCKFSQEWQYEFQIG